MVQDYGSGLGPVLEIGLGGKICERASHKFREAELGLGLSWGCSVPSARLTHSDAMSVKLIHIQITSVRLIHT